MKKQYLFGLMAAILALALAFTGCDLLGLGGTDDNSDSTQEPYENLIIEGWDSTGTKAIKTIFSTTRKNTKQVMAPMDNDSYEIQYGNDTISKGSIKLSGILVTFTPTSTYGNKTFEATMVKSGNNNILNFPDGIYTTSGTPISYKKGDSVINPEITGDLDADINFSGGTSQPLKVTLKEDTGGVRSFQWYSVSSQTSYANGTAISATETYSPTTDGTFYYYVRITNASGGFARSRIAKVTVKGGSTPSGDVVGNLGAGDDVVDDKDPDKISITGNVKVTGDFNIPSTMTLTISGKGNLTIPAGKTITVSGKLIIASGGTLSVNGNVVVASEGTLDVNKDGKLGGNGKITVGKDGGKMQIPKLDSNTQTLKDVTGTIVVEAGGELIILDDNKTEYPWIGTVNSKNVGADLVITDGYIALKLYQNTITSGTTSIPYMVLFGNVMVLGPSKGTGNNITRETVKIEYMFTVNPDATLTIGNGSEKSTLEIVSGMIFNNGTIIVKEESIIEASEVSAIIGPVTGADGQPITFSPGSNGSKGKWKNPEPPKATS